MIRSPAEFNDPLQMKSQSQNTFTDYDDSCRNRSPNVPQRGARLIDGFIILNGFWFATPGFEVHSRASGESYKKIRETKIIYYLNANEWSKLLEKHLPSNVMICTSLARIEWNCFEARSIIALWTNCINFKAVISILLPILQLIFFHCSE